MINKILSFHLWGPWGGEDVGHEHPGYAHPRVYFKWFKEKGFDCQWVADTACDRIMFFFKFKDEAEEQEFLKILPIEIKSQGEKMYYNNNYGKMSEDK